MIIDSHAHIEEVPGSPWFDPPETMVRLMDEAKIDKAIVMTYRDAPSSVIDVIEYVKNSVAKFPDRLIGYARINPDSRQAEDLLINAITKYKMKGLKLHPLGYRNFPDSKGTVNLIKLAVRFNAPILFHCGDEDYTLPLQIERVAFLVPDAKIILGHMGGYFHVNDSLKVALRNKNIILETSGMPYPSMIKKAVELIGPKRVLFASDGPGCDPKIELEKIKISGLTKDEEKLVMGENIQKILDEVKHEL